MKNDFNNNWRKANTKLVYCVACADAIGISYGHYMALVRECNKLNPRAIKRAIKLTENVKVETTCLE